MEPSRWRTAWRRPWPVGPVLLLLAVGGLWGCRGTPKVQPLDAAAGPVDLLSLLDRAEVRTPTAGYVRATQFAAGEARDVLHMHPPARVTFPPVRLTLESRLELSFAVAEFEWDKSGDGVGFSVYARAEGRDEVKLFTAYVDPKREPADRRWHTAELTLGTFAGQVVSLSLETDVGPNGDGLYDGAGWSRAVVVSGRN